MAQKTDLAVVQMGRDAANLLSQGRYTASVRICTRMLDSAADIMVRDRAVIHCNRAAAYMRLELYKHALKDCERALGVDAACLRAHYTKGVALLGLGRTPEAVDAWRVGSEIWGDVELQLEMLKLSQSAHDDVLARYGARAAATASRPAAAAAVAAAPNVGAGSRAQQQPPASQAKPAAAEAEVPSGGAAAAKADTPSHAVAVAEEMVASAIAAERARSGPAYPPNALKIASHRAPLNDEALRSALVAAGLSSEDADSSEGGIAQAALAVARRGMVHHGVGNAQIDEAIALGYLQVNTGNLVQGIQVFDAILVDRPGTVAALLGRGTARALQGDLTGAVKDFTEILTKDQSVTDAWKRRGQSRAALGDDRGAAADLGVAVKLAEGEVDKTSDSVAGAGAAGVTVGPGGALIPGDKHAMALKELGDSYFQRGVVLHKMRDYRRSLKDFRRAVDIDDSNQTAINFLGLSLNSLGDCEDALTYYRKAVAMDDKFKEAWTNMAQCCKDLGRYKEAEEFFARALLCDPSYVNAYQLRAAARYAVGQPLRCIADLTVALQVEPQNEECRLLRGVAHHSMGQYEKAAADYRELVSRNPRHPAWYMMQNLLYHRSRLDAPVAEYCLDHDQYPYYKEAWAKKSDPAVLVGRPGFKPMMDPGARGWKKGMDVAVNKPLVADAGLLATRASELGKCIQYSATGFLPNRRQHRACGLAALHAAQRLRSALGLGPGPHRPAASGAGASGERTDHPFGYRDFFDVIVKWRQLSEPNDAVVWVDLLSPEEFAAGFGSHTPMLSGQTKVVRYHSQFLRALTLARRLMREQFQTLVVDGEEDGEGSGEEGGKHAYGDIVGQVIDASRDCKSLHDLMGRDFWVVTPCESTARAGQVLEGTRLTMQSSPPDGYEFSIRTPCTPQRWIEFDTELTAHWKDLCDALKDPNQGIDEIGEIILRLSYYWFNFIPLARGSAFCGLTMIISLFLAAGYELTAPVPENVQVDWESILCPSAASYADVLRPWMWPGRVQSDIADTLPSVEATFPTLRHMIHALNKYSSK